MSSILSICSVFHQDHVIKNRKFIHTEVSTIEKSLKGILKSFFTEDVLTVQVVRKDASSTLKEKVGAVDALHFSGIRYFVCSGYHSS